MQRWLNGRMTLAGTNKKPLWNGHLQLDSYERFFALPHGGSAQAEEFHDRDAKRSGIDRVDPMDPVGGDARLFIGGAGERDHRRTAGHAVADLDHVAERVDRRVARQEALVNDDAAARVELQPGAARQLAVGADADRKDPLRAPTLTNTRANCRPAK